MNAKVQKVGNRPSRVANAQLPEISEGDAIFNLRGIDSMPAVGRTLLRPEDERVSLPPAFDEYSGAMAPLTRFLGPELTAGSPAWSPDPIPLMRGLQKLLVEHSLTLDEGDRTECMNAIRIVENAVQLRLRFQQMRMNEFERDMNLPKGARHEKENTA